VSVKIVLVAACALVDADGRVLLAQRPAGKSMAGLWEFPGGKIEDGELPEQSLSWGSSSARPVWRRSHSPATATRIFIC
jgi:8-oxo-dGTP pyrophosphatase MutT (NUDIX family)